MITDSNIMFDIEANEFLESKKYYVVETIGHGGFASVYTVFSQKYNQTFVCKISSLKHKEEENLKKTEAFQNELDVLCKSYHPNIVHIYDYYTYKNRLYIIMEYCPNGSLLDLIRKSGVLSSNQVVCIMQQLVSAINYLHLNNIAHLDIKPSNILIDINNKIKLIDFGLSKTFSPESPICTSKRGSILYASPEILTKPCFDPFKADIYSFGVTIYQLVTGKFPFTGKTISELVDQQRLQSYIFLDKDRKLNDIIKRCLKFRQEDRPNAKYLLSAIQKLSSSSKTMTTLPVLTNPKGEKTPIATGGRPGIAPRNPLTSTLIVRKKRNVI